MLSIPSKVQHKNTREFISEQIKPYPQTVNYTELRNKPTFQALFPRANACTFPFPSSFRRAPARGCPLQAPIHVLPDYSLPVFHLRRGLPGRRPAYCPAPPVENPSIRVSPLPEGGRSPFSLPPCISFASQAAELPNQPASGKPEGFYRYSLILVRFMLHVLT